MPLMKVYRIGEGESPSGKCPAATIQPIASSDAQNTRTGVDKMAKVQTSSRGWRIIYSIAAAAPACAAALLPSTAMAAASTLYGLVAGPGGSPALFGSIDLSTGAFT